MRVYELEYRDADPASPLFRLRLRAHSLEHLVERFTDAPDGEGWVLERAARVPPDRPRYRWRWHALEVRT